MIRNAAAKIGRRTIISGLVGLVIGTFFGWMVLGWNVSPVTWTDADPWDLRQVHKEAYVLLVAESYSLNSDADLAIHRLEGFKSGEVAEIISTLLEENEAAGDLEGKRRLQYLAMVMDVTPAAETPGPEQGAPSATARLSASVRSLLPICGLGLVLLLIVGLIAIIVFRLLQQRAGRAPAEVPTEQAVSLPPSPGAALGRFVTTYTIGDDGYDTSFNIETHGAEGEFMGACGVGFSEALGEGSPDKIAAFEVWVFDRTDMDNVQTVTKVLMSEFAYNSQVLRDKMKDRGEAVLVEKGKTVVIEAVGLDLRAEIIDFQYGDDPSLPANSYFEKLTTQLSPAFKS